ncbi:hypothetical protein B0H34DRAFT_710809 [Crassisporium funariophilum]|nr:hypothetical protein B0H34DRAFT_710809 [Crassisporium funariophilum]
MDAPQLSLDTYIALALVLATPWLYLTLSPPSPLSSSASAPKSRKTQALSLLLLAHTLYLLHALLVTPPPNIFAALAVPLNTPPLHLREALVAAFGGKEESVPGFLEVLVKRLGLMDLRTLYIRFGHDVMIRCSYCQSFDDFALYAFPGALWEYIREIAFIGVLTLPSSTTAHLRPLGLGLLLAALMAEVYYTLTAQISIPPRGLDMSTTTLHDTFLQSRHLLFLLLPLFLTLLPHLGNLGLHHIPILNIFIPAPPSSFSSQSHSQAQSQSTPMQFHLQGQNGQTPQHQHQQPTLPQLTAQTLQTLNHLVPTLHLLKYVHAAVMRSQSASSSSNSAARESEGEMSIHARASQWWAHESREGASITSDPGVRNVMRAAGLSLDPATPNANANAEGGKTEDGALLKSAKMAVGMMIKQGGVPSEHWVPG